MSSVRFMGFSIQVNDTEAAQLRVDYVVDDAPNQQAFFNVPGGGVPVTDMTIVEKTVYVIVSCVDSEGNAIVAHVCNYLDAGGERTLNGTIDPGCQWSGDCFGSA